MPLISFHDRDMLKEPFTVGELARYLSEYDPNLELRLMGSEGELIFNRFKGRGENLLTMEFDDVGWLKRHGIMADSDEKSES